MGACSSTAAGCRRDGAATDVPPREVAPAMPAERRPANPVGAGQPIPTWTPAAGPGLAQEDAGPWAMTRVRAIQNLWAVRASGAPRARRSASSRPSLDLSPPPPTAPNACLQVHALQERLIMAGPPGCGPLAALPAAAAALAGQLGADAVGCAARCRLCVRGTGAGGVLVKAVPVAVADSIPPPRHAPAARCAGSGRSQAAAAPSCWRPRGRSPPLPSRSLRPSARLARPRCARPSWLLARATWTAASLSPRLSRSADMSAIPCPTAPRAPVAPSRSRRAPVCWLPPSRRRSPPPASHPCSGRRSAAVSRTKSARCWWPTAPRPGRRGTRGERRRGACALGL
jgi:hypothetical protein